MLPRWHTLKQAPLTVAITWTARILSHTGKALAVVLLPQAQWVVATAITSVQIESDGDRRSAEKLHRHRNPVYRNRSCCSLGCGTCRHYLNSLVKDSFINLH